ncbi:PIG-L domain-containing protein [Kaistia sp. 32K]|uniref:PIG-L deacetylase family protein n=1 Tax=Kaistia sp. 32K TaxID=2795690 RepID=UPI00191675D9|nr:PIG-L deacetylase family protein [Kaistia sp. 32K]BCP53913.1 PIG-L domain-containing protein [Kaistia sp. 32K]
MTGSLETFGRTLVIAPHPDDEILGAGGTMARLARAGQEVFVAVVTSGQPPDFSAEQVTRVQGEAARAHALLGVRQTLWLGQPAAQLFDTPHAQLNAALRKVVLDLNPTTLIIPFVGDIHADHQLTFLSAMVAARPHQAEFPATILAYETLSETNWNAPYVTPGFLPNVFIDVNETLTTKIEAMQMFASQLRPFPHERSVEALTALAMLRGASVHCRAAEAFVLVRHVIRA